MLNSMINNSLQSATDCVLCLALDVGEGLLKNGDSVHHVEDTVKRICRAYGGVHIETFVISSLILASIRMNDGSYSSQLRRVYSSSNNMSALENFNALSRRICKETPDFQTAQGWLKETKKKKAYPAWLSLIGHMLAAGSFAVFFGGSIRDGLAGAVLGLVIGLISMLKLSILNINILAKTLITSFVAGLVSYCTVLIGLGENVDMVMIGSIMLLIPGLAFGNALRDLLCGDFLTGVLKTVQSCLTAVLIAFGYSGAILIMRAFDVPTGTPVIAHGFFVNLVAAILGTVAFGAVFCVRPNCLWVTALGGGFVYSIYYLFEYLEAPVFVCALCCAVFGAAFSEVFARIIKIPAIVFLTPAIISIVPGGSLYYTMSALVSGNNSLLFDKGLATLFTSTGLVTGTILVSILVTAINTIKTSKKK